MRCKIQEKRPGFLPFQKGLGLAGNGVGHVFVNPKSFLPALHVADPADPVHNRLVMPVARLHLQKFRIRLSRRLTGKRVFVTYLNRIRRIQIHHPPILHIYAGHPVAGRRNQE